MTEQSDFVQLARQMSKIHIARQRQLLGKFSPEEVAVGLRSGRFQPDDLAWRDPMEVWKPLGEFDDLPNVEPEPEPEAPQLTETSLVPPPVPKAEPAWERRGELGLFKAIVETVKQVVSLPAVTFREMKTEGGYRSPLLYWVIVFTVTTWVAMGYQLAVSLVNPEASPMKMVKNVPPEVMITSQIAGMIVTPVLVAFGIFITAGIVHGAFVALGAAQKPFEATFRVCCYSLASASVFQLLPLCGGLMYLGSGVALLIIGMREVHGSNTWKATAGVVIPALLGCGLFLGFYTVLFAAMGAQGMLK